MREGPLSLSVLGYLLAVGILSDPLFNFNSVVLAPIVIVTWAKILIPIDNSVDRGCRSMDDDKNQ